MKSLLTPYSVSAPPSAPEAAPSAAPNTGIRKIAPISRPQNEPETAPSAVVLRSWFSLILPPSCITAMAASPISIRYSFCSEISFWRISSARASVG